MRRRWFVSGLIATLLASPGQSRGRRSRGRWARGGGGYGGGSSAPSSDLYFTSCRDARAQGYSRLPTGQAGYRAGLDRDGHGIACE